jgi:hypothetical protein
LPAATNTPPSGPWPPEELELDPPELLELLLELEELDDVLELDAPGGTLPTEANRYRPSLSQAAKVATVPPSKPIKPNLVYERSCMIPLPYIRPILWPVQRERMEQSIVPKNRH